MNKKINLSIAIICAVLFLFCLVQLISGNTYGIAGLLVTLVMGALFFGEWYHETHTKELTSHELEKYGITKKSSIDEFNVSEN